MTSLIACLGTGQGTWTNVLQLVAALDWDKVFLVTHKFGKEQLQLNRPIEFIVIDEYMKLREIEEKIRQDISGKLGLEVAVNLTSGTGLEHMALISAILKEGLALRLVNYDNEVVEV